VAFAAARTNGASTEKIDDPDYAHACTPTLR
jgi:hypothetical protein